MNAFSCAKVGASKPMQKLYEFDGKKGEEAVVVQHCEVLSAEVLPDSSLKDGYRQAADQIKIMSMKEGKIQSKIVFQGKATAIRDKNNEDENEEYKFRLAPGNIAVGDIDGDKDLDILVIDEWDEAENVVLINDGKGNFTLIQ